MRDMDLRRMFGVIFVVSFCWFGVEGWRLSYDFYERTWPQVEDIVRAGIQSLSLSDSTSPAALLRLMFHDCQVQGCDASILIDPHEHVNMPSEMASTKNFGIRKRESISMIKSMVEAECPQQVSCADILILAACDAIAMAGGPQISVPLGRRDLPSPHSSELADAVLPPADLGVDGTLSSFAKKGMSIQESVAILGAHTLGITHCMNILSRLYSPEGVKDMEPGFEMILRLSCPPISFIPYTSFVVNDPTMFMFDNQYYVNATRGRGILKIDAELLSSPRTAPFVKQFAVDQDGFFRAFSSAFIKLFSFGVLTSDQGVIRESCNAMSS